MMHHDSSPRHIGVHMLPELAPDVAGSTVVVVDVLRSTTTIVEALAAGALGVIPVLTVEEALQLRDAHDPPLLAGGERHGKPIEGFDLGNSPEEYRPERVAGRWIVFTSTNGTRAILRCHEARRLLLAAFVNLSAVCDALTGEPRIDIICSGTRGQITREDVLAAGAIVANLLATSGGGESAASLNDQARLAHDAWTHHVRTLTGDTWLHDILQRTQGGRNLLEIGYDRDLHWAAVMDRHDLVPEWDAATNRITAGRGLPSERGGS